MADSQWPFGYRRVCYRLKSEKTQKTHLFLFSGKFLSAKNETTQFLTKFYEYQQQLPNKTR